MTDNSSIGRRLIRGSVLRILSATASGLVGFLMLPYLVAHLGTHWYGVWVSVGSLVGGFYLLDLGLSTAVTRYVTEALSVDDSDRANNVISTVFWIYCGLGGVLAGVSVIMATVAPVALSDKDETPLIQMLLLIAGMTLAIGFPFKALAGVIQAKLRYDLLAAIQLAILAAATASTVYVVSVGYGVLGLALVGLFASVTSDFAFIALSRHVFPQLDIRRQRFSRALVRELFSFSVWAFLINFSSQIRLRIDLLVVAGVQSAAAATHYAVGARTAETANEFLYQATNMVQPILTRYHATGDHERMRWALIFLTKLNVVLGAFVAGLLLILGEPFIARWMGPSFRDSQSVLYLLTVALTVGFVVNPLEYTLIAILRQRFLAVINVVDAAANLSLSILLGMKMGLPGVALGTLLPMVISRLFVIAPYTCHFTALPLTSYAAAVLRPLATSLLILLPLAHFSEPFLLGSGYATFFTTVMLAAVFYAPLMFYVVFDASEKQQLVDAMRGLLGSRARGPGAAPLR